MLRVNAIGVDISGYFKFVFRFFFVSKQLVQSSLLFVVIAVMIYCDLSSFLQCCVVMNSCERILCHDSEFPQLL